MNRSEELKRAIRRARMPSTAVVLFDTLADRSYYPTAVIPGEYQPRSLTDWPTGPGGRGRSPPRR